jgi:hypothetical protein
LNQKLKQQYSSSEDHGFHVSNSNYGFACGAVVAEPMEAGELGFCDLGLEKESLEGAANLVMLLLPLLNMLTKCAEMPRLGLLGLLKLQDISGTSSHGFQLFASHASHASHEQLL